MHSLGSLLFVSLILPLGTDDDPTSVAIARGRLFLESRQFDQAAEQFLLVRASRPEDVESAYMLGLALFGAGRFREAEEPLWVAARAYPEDGLPREFLGRIYFQLSRYDEAVDSFLSAAALNPREGRTHNHLGAAWLRLGKPTEALEAFQQAIRFDPSYVVAHYNVGVLSVLTGERLTGIYHLLEAARLDPTDSDPTEALADLYAGEGDLKQAERWYRESANRKPDVPRLWLGLGRTCERMGRLFDAEGAYRSACELPDVGVDAQLELGRLLECNGRFGLAQQAYSNALEIDPDSRVAHLRLADLAEDLDDPLAAQGHLEELIGLLGHRPELLARLCDACERSGDTQGALRAYKQLVIANRGTHADLLAIAGLMVSSRIEGIANTEQGYELVQALVEGDRESSAASLYVLSQAEAALGKRASAAASLKKAAGLLEHDEPITAVLLRHAEQSEADR